ncbi:MAG: sodium:proton antiporter, partial [Acidimicrobiaceae bacterium]|nr:sodium:proton antiporter [Acidimicrobiaceae bacterium]
MAGSDSLLKRPTFASSDNSLAKFVARPVLRFIDREVAGGVLLLIATTAALVWVNSGWGDGYHSFWHTEIELAVGTWHLPHMSLEHFVNDALMALFFFVVGLEIKRELVTGDLRSFRAAALPAIGAVGGMVVPALLYFAFNTAGEASRGWGIPMATDIAFAVGIVALLGSRVSPKIKLFLLTLAIVDEIGAIAVIAI